VRSKSRSLTNTRINSELPAKVFDDPRDYCYINQDLRHNQYERWLFLLTHLTLVSFLVRGEQRSRPARILFWFLGRDPTTSIADKNLDCNVPFSAESIRIVKYVCCHLDGSVRSILDRIGSEVGGGSLTFLASTMTYLGVFPGPTWNSNSRRTASSLGEQRISKAQGVRIIVRTEKHKSPHEGFCEN
jgi:hypothetical protein